jgi:hypothetical protein
MRGRTRDRPQGAADADQADRESPDGIDPTGIAGMLLDHPGACHQDGQGECHRDQCLEI